MKDADKQGVAAIISKSQAAGLGRNVRSWAGTGHNQPVLGDQVAQAVSPEQIEVWASQAGTTSDAMRGVLAQALPHMVDHLTPDGQVPAQTNTSDLSSLIGRFLGGAGGVGHPD